LSIWLSQAVEVVVLPQVQVVAQVVIAQVHNLLLLELLTRLLLVLAEHRLQLIEAVQVATLCFLLSLLLAVVAVVVAAVM
jgi:hypothetical protein